MFQPLSHSIWLICVFGLSSAWKWVSPGELNWLGEYFSYLVYKMQRCRGICNNMHHLLALTMYCILALKTTNIFQLPPKKPQTKQTQNPKHPRVQCSLCSGSFPMTAYTGDEDFSCVLKPEHFCTSSIPQEIKYCFCFPNTSEKASLLISTAKTAHERNAAHFLTKI